MGAFTLLELVLNLIILAMIAAIAVPRVTQFARAARTKTTALIVTEIQHAIEGYCAEHGRYPGYDPASETPSADWFVDQLTQYSDVQGSVSDTLAYPFIYGPYLRAPFPTNPLNGRNTVWIPSGSGAATPPDTCGWIAEPAIGRFRPCRDAEDTGAFDPDEDTSSTPQVGPGTLP